MNKIANITILTILMSMIGAKAFAHDIAVPNSDGVTIYYNWSNEGKTELKDLSEKTLTDFSFKLPAHSCFINRLAVIELDGKLGLIDPSGNLVCEGFSSALWAPQGIEGAPWEMYYCRNGEEMHYYHGQGGEFIELVHDFLLSNQIAYLLEKDNIWYYPDDNNNIVSLFEYNFNM